MLHSFRERGDTLTPVPQRLPCLAHSANSVTLPMRLNDMQQTVEISQLLRRRKKREGEVRQVAQCCLDQDTADKPGKYNAPPIL